MIFKRARSLDAHFDSSNFTLSHQLSAKKLFMFNYRNTVDFFSGKKEKKKILGQFPETAFLVCLRTSFLLPSALQDSHVITCATKPRGNASSAPLAAFAPLRPGQYVCLAVHYCPRHEGLRHIHKILPLSDLPQVSWAIAKDQMSALKIFYWFSS